MGKGFSLYPQFFLEAPSISHLRSKERQQKVRTEQGPRDQRQESSPQELQVPGPTGALTPDQGSTRVCLHHDPRSSVTEGRIPVPGRREKGAVFLNSVNRDAKD